MRMLRGRTGNCQRAFPAFAEDRMTVTQAPGRHLGQGLSLLAAFAMVLAGIAMTCPASAASAPSFVKKGARYQSIRTNLKAKQWTPAGEALREDGGCPGDDDRCSYSEARECSGTGLGFCNMVWRHKDGTLLVITAVGETDLKVHGKHIK